MILWSEIEVNIAVILSCAPAFKTLLQSLFPSFMSSLVTGGAATTARKTRGGATHSDAYVLQSRGRDDVTGFRTVIHASPPKAGDSKSVDSREPIVDYAAAPAPGFRVETNITVRSSSKESVEEELRSIA